MHECVTKNVLALCLATATLAALPSDVHAGQGAVMNVASSSGAAKPVADVAAPEAVTFLMLAQLAAEKHKQAHGSYPTEWHQMDFAYAYGPYNKNDAGLRATAQDGNKWRPKKANYSYEIVVPSKDELLIRALDGSGKVAYEIRNGQNRPAKL
jgi:hypothetical protein